MTTRPNLNLRQVDVLARAVTTAVEAAYAISDDPPASLNAWLARLDEANCLVHITGDAERPLAADVGDALAQLAGLALAMLADLDTGGANR